jgi:undecaprenyl pyrophosphate synthase
MLNVLASLRRVVAQRSRARIVSCATLQLTEGERRRREEARVLAIMHGTLREIEHHCYYEEYKANHRRIHRACAAKG